MSDSDFITVYNVADTGYRTLWFPAIGLVFIGILFFVLKRGSSRIFLFPTWIGKRSGYLLFGFCFMVLWTLTTLIITMAGYIHARELLLSGRAQYVEGNVQNFVPMPYSGHALESFSVGYDTFHYSDYVVTPGFNNTASHGGPIREGLFVRIWYSGDEILKLQVLKGSP